MHMYCVHCGVLATVDVIMHTVLLALDSV